MTTRDKNRLTRVIKINIGATSKRIFELYNAGAPRMMSRASLYRVLKKMGYVRRAIRKSVVVSRKNVILRKKWARSRRKWDPDDWKQYIFSDESSVVVGKDNRMYCWRKRDEKDSPHIICPPRNRKFTVMVWGAITYSGERTLKWVQGNINSQKYVDVLEEKLLPPTEYAFPHGGYTFMHDNAPVHKSAFTTSWLDTKGIYPTIWSSQSPDLNVIENMWRDVKIELRKVKGSITSPEHLYQEVERCLNNVSTQRIQYNSIPRRLHAVLKMKGQLSKY